MPQDATVVIGAGPAGLACASALLERGERVSVLERGAGVAPAWRRHYDRLHLHTHRAHSGLPGLPMPRNFPKYPARDQVVSYLEDYARKRGIEPRFGVEVRTIRAGAPWRLVTGEGEVDAPNVIVATGLASCPHRPSWPGQGGFPGTILHSSGYRNPAPFSGQRVLVVGFGNSGGEIAMDLSDNGVKTELSVRGPVNLLPRDFLGLPILSLAIATERLPTGLADQFGRFVRRLALGDVRRLGLRMSRLGPRAQIEQSGRIPLLDIGTVSRIRSGRIRLRPGIAAFEGGRVIFSDGSWAEFDAVILATGYRPDLRALLPDTPDVLTATGAPRVSGAPSGRAGLYFCNFRPSATGQLREAGLEAARIAGLIAGGGA